MAWVAFTAVIAMFSAFGGFRAGYGSGFQRGAELIESALLVGCLEPPEKFSNPRGSLLQFADFCASYPGMTRGQ